MNSNKKCLCVIDSHGLRDISLATGNLKGVILAELEKGTIAVPASVWKEFSGLFPDEAAEIGPYISVKISINMKYRVAAASLAEQMNAGFSPNRYDQMTYLYAAAIANCKKIMLISSNSEFERYEDMGCALINIQTFVNDLEFLEE